MTETDTARPIVSIIMPVYNPGGYLSICLDSVRQQSYTDWELILVDDGSTDGSGSLCDEAASMDNRIRVLHQANGGVSCARNAGLDEARGKYVAFIDADDVILPTYLEKLVGAAEMYGTDLALCGFVRFCNGDDTELEYLPTHAPIGIYPDLRSFLHVYAKSRTNMFGVCVWAKLYRMETIRANHLRFDPEISYEEDCVFNIGYLSHIQTVTTIGEALYRYRQMDESLSKSYRKNTFRFLVNGFQNRCRLLKQFGREDLIRNQEQIFLVVAKTAAIKAFRSDLSRKEKLAAYEEIMGFPETQQVASVEKRSKSRFTNMIAGAIRSRDPKKLERVLHLWNMADKAQTFKKKLIWKAKCFIKRKDV